MGDDNDYDPTLTEDATMFQTLENRDKLLAKGFCTAAGRGTRLPNKPRPVKDVRLAAQSQIACNSPVKTGVGRGNIVEQIITIDQAAQRQRRDPFGCELQAQLRQVEDDGYSNRYIECNYPNTSAISSLVEAEATTDEAREQFEKAELEEAVLQLKLESAALESASVPSTGCSPKKKQGNGRKGRGFRKVTLGGDVECDTQGKKSIRDIFDTPPVDYQQAYFTEKNVKSKLFHRSNFPAL